METKNIILKLRTERGMSQDELADKIMVTRQAVSRWENGDTVPNTDSRLCEYPKGMEDYLCTQKYG